MSGAGRKQRKELLPYQPIVDNPFIVTLNTSKPSTSDRPVLSNDTASDEEATTSDVPSTSNRSDLTASLNVNEEISSISIGPNTYPVIRTLFQSQTLVGRSTNTFMVRLSDDRVAVLKDSWIPIGRPSEADFLTGIDIPFGPKLIDHCTLRDTAHLRIAAVNSTEVGECRQKRRVLTYPAGVHISNFCSLWELMVVMLDIVIGMI